MRKRSTFELSADNAKMIYDDASRFGLRSDNAALNMDLRELREWRAGLRVHKKPPRSVKR